MTLIPALCNLYLQVLSSLHAEREVCPTVWETGERATVCSWVTYVTLSEPPDVRGGQDSEPCVLRVLVSEPPVRR